MGAGLGRTTGWVHRATLTARGVEYITGAEYVRIDDAGLHLRIDGTDRVLEVDDVVLVGGAEVAAELDAKRAIEQATRVAAAL